MAEVGLIDPEHLLHRLGGEADLHPGDLFAGRLPPFDVGELDGIGVAGREGRAGRKRLDLLTIAFGGEELVGEGLDVYDG